MKPPPAPRPPDDDLFFRIADAVIALVISMFKYLIRRTRSHPLLGGLYLLVAAPAFVLLLLALRENLTIAMAPPYTTPPPVFPFSQFVPEAVFWLLGLLVGLVVGFDRWVAWRHDRPKLDPPASQTTPRPAPDVCVLGRAYIRRWEATRTEFVLTPGDLFTLTADHLRTHLLVVAPPGAGKTSSILTPLFFFCQRVGAAIFVFDAKGNNQDWQAGWFDETFDLTHPAHSMRLNIWSGRTPRQAGERLGEALIDPASPPYFVNSAKDAIAGLVAAHYAAHGQMPSLKTLLVYLRNPTSRQDLVADLERGGRGAASDEVLDIRRIDSLAEGKNDVLGNLDNALTPLARGEIAPILSTDGTGTRIANLLQAGGRVRFVLPVAEYPRLAPILGRLVLAQFTDEVLAPGCNRDLLKMVIVDEAHNFMTPALAKGMAMARANLGSYVLALQSLQQIADPTLREDLLSVAGNKLVLAGAGDLDSAKFSALFGAVEREYHSASASQSTGTNSSRSQGRGGVGGGLFSTTGGLHHQSSTLTGTARTTATGTSSQFRLRPTWLPAEIRGMPPFHALIERRSNQGEVTPATLVHLDRALVTAIMEDQEYQRYQQTRQSSRAQMPASTTAPAAPRAAPSPAVAPPMSTGTTVHQEETTSDAGADAGAGATRPIANPTGEDSTSATDQPVETTVPVETDEASVSAAPWRTAMVERIVAELGLDRATATELVTCAQERGRDATYLEDLLCYVEQAPHSGDPGAIFKRLVETNAVRRRPTSPASPLEEGG